MDIKFILALLSSSLGILAFIPYIKNIFNRTIKPHAFTWLIWFITQGTATIAIWYGGGKFGALSLGIGTLFVFIVFLLSLGLGSRYIRKFDVFVLILALLAIVLWWQLDQPYLTVLLLSIIDFMVYLPSYRKTYVDPYSESYPLWILFAGADILAILALENFNFLTAAYLITITSSNVILVAIIYLRRQMLAKVRV